MEAESKTYKGHEISIEYDECGESPREWDNICIIHLAHRKYGFGDVNHSTRESVDEARKEAEQAGDICLDLYMYDHSGVTISLSPFSCPWDSGRCGFVQVPRKKMIEEFGKKVFTPKLKKRAMKIAKGEVDTLDKFIRGEVYGYVVDDNGDSCWGYYSIEEAMEEAESIIDWIVKKDTKKHFEQVKTWIKNKVPLQVRKTLYQELEV